MPSMTTAQLSGLYSAASSFPYTNKMILDSHDRGAYLVVDFKQDETGTTISAHPDVEVSVKNDTFRNMIQEQFGSRPETRSDIQNRKANLNRSHKENEGRRLLTVGAFITLVDTQGQRGVPLHLRNGDMPLAGCLTHPSGLASEKPHKALWQRVNEEAGYCYVDKVNKEINVIVLQPDNKTLQQNPDLLEKIINDKMKNQRYIRLAVSNKTGIAEVTNTDEWGIKIVRVDSTLDVNCNQEQSGLIDRVQFKDLLAGQLPMAASVHDDPKRQTVSLTMPLLARVPFPLDQMVFIDPEGFNRKVALYSEADLTMLPTAKIPALEDYVRKLNGQESARLRVTAAPASVTASPVLPANQ